jgi:hypothetical protein
MKLFIKLVLPLIMILSLGGGCSKDILNENPPHILSGDNLYRDLTGFETGLNGAYALVRRERSGPANNRVNNLLITIAMSGTDIMYGNYAAGDHEIFDFWGQLNNPQQPFLREVWVWLYETVNAVNVIIERAEKPGINWAEADKNRVLAEARTIRAWAYRHLTYLWGDVPLSLRESTGLTVKTDWTRASVAEIRQQMEQDLLFAEQHLPVTSANPGKLVKGVAQHYLAELYLAMGDNAKAKTKAQELINSGTYKLITGRYGKKASQPGVPFMDMFVDGNSNRSEGNTEALWVLQHEFETVGGEGFNIMRRWLVNRYEQIRIGGRSPFRIVEEYGGRGLGRLSPTRYALQNYEPADDRGSEFAWRWYYVINNQVPAGYKLGDTIRLPVVNEAVLQADRPSTRKWDNAPATNVTGNNSYNDQIYLRLAETYLILAEAQFNLGELSDAAETLNVLRRRARASQISAGDVTIDFILDERARELFAEEHRRYALLRTNKWLERTRKYNLVARPHVQERDKLLPVPQDVIDANIGLAMPQNPGYN